MAKGYKLKLKINLKYCNKVTGVTTKIYSEVIQTYSKFMAQKNSFLILKKELLLV
jgi:hypothetical protein